MKIHVKQIAVLIALMAMIVLVGCEKNDSETPFGDSVIYIPQATVGNGQNQIYMVPSGKDKNTYNFRVDTLGKIVKVFLGVTRSGLDTYKAYSVDVSTRTDTVATLIANGLINPPSTTILPVEVLPQTDYNLPTTVSVTDGKYSEGFYLAIKLDALKTYAGKKVALCVVISNPTNYTLSTVNNKVIILIDVDALKLP